MARAFWERAPKLSRVSEIGTADAFTSAFASDGVAQNLISHYDLGYFDDETCRLEPINNPFGPKLLPMSPE